MIFNLFYFTLLLGNNVCLDLQNFEISMSYFLLVNIIYFSDINALPRQLGTGTIHFLQYLFMHASDKAFVWQHNILVSLSQFKVVKLGGPF